MGGKVGIVKKHFPHGGKGGSKCSLKHYLDEIQTLTNMLILIRWLDTSNKVPVCYAQNSDSFLITVIRRISHNTSLYAPFLIERIEESYRKSE